MANVKAIKSISQFNGCLMIWNQVFIVNLKLSFDLANNQFGVTISFKILYPHLLSKSEANEQIIVLGYIIGTSF